MKILLVVLVFAVGEHQPVKTIYAEQPSWPSCMKAARWTNTEYRSSHGFTFYAYCEKQPEDKAT